MRAVCYGIVLLASVWPWTAGALELGNIKVHSHLGQPLDARITVTRGIDELGKNLLLRLAEPLEFARAGIDRPYVLHRLRFVLAKANNGNEIIRVSTLGKLDEPALAFLLTTTTGENRRVHQFDITLDPAPRKKANRRTPVGIATPAQNGAERRITVKPGDSLSLIAARVRPNRTISLEQMMNTLLRLNPQAFINNDRDRLIAGTILTVPVTNPADHSQENSTTAKDKPEANATNDRKKAAEKTVQTQLRILSAPSSVTKQDGPKHPKVLAMEQQIQSYREDTEKAEIQNRELRERLIKLREHLVLVKRQLTEHTEIQQKLMLKPKTLPVAKPMQPISVKSASAKPIAVQAPVSPAPSPPPAANVEVEVVANSTINWQLIGYIAVAAILMFGAGVFILLKSWKKMRFPTTVLDVERFIKETSSAPQSQLESILAQVDASLAHGQVDDAEKLLKDAAEYYPFDPILMYKLLEIYAHTEREDAFVSLVEQVQETLQRDAPGAWREVEKFGSRLVPYHPLFLRSDSPQGMAPSSA